MKVTFFFRNPDSGFSIERVFSSVIQGVKVSNPINIKKLPFVRAMPADVLKNLLFTYKNRDKRGINHVTGDVHYIILALIGCKTVLTIHDLVNIKHGNFLARSIRWFFWIYLPVKLADRVTCISQETRSKLARYVTSKNVSVVYNPIDSAFQLFEKPFCKEKPVILHIGCGWNKNLLSVIEALEGVNCHLRIIGKITDIQIAHLKKYNLSYSVDQGLTDAEILEEYKNCDIVSFPSIYEGFGMPVIEAQQTGRAVLTSTVEPLPEIGANGALYVDPFNINEIKNGFVKLINDDQYRENLIKNGLENIRRFSAEKIASDYQKIYEELI